MAKKLMATEVLSWWRRKIDVEVIFYGPEDRTPRLSNVLARMSHANVPLHH
jgi:hypothetical protein